MARKGGVWQSRSGEVSFGEVWLGRKFAEDWTGKFGTERWGLAVEEFNG